MAAITMKQARVGVDMTQREMAQAIGCGYNTYRKWEQNPGDMPVRVAQKFCEIVHRSYDEILFA